MATQNGARYIRQQLNSILPQLDGSGEVIIFDDCSTDNTVAIIQSYNDDRIKLYKNAYRMGVVKNFELSLNKSQGEYIFLADQDDLWLPKKIEVMLGYLKKYDLVTCNCLLVDDNLQVQSRPYFEINNSKKGLLKNLYKNSYMGCCMAFNRNLLNRSLPFPEKIPMHDLWIGLVGELHFTTKFINEILVHHRLHSHNATPTGKKSNHSLFKKIVNRLRMLKYIFFTITDRMIELRRD